MIICCEPAGVFIGEAAQTMVQNVDYEIPHLQKQMTKCNQQMADADRKQSEYTRAAEAAANNYKKVTRMQAVSRLSTLQCRVLCCVIVLCDRAVCYAVLCSCHVFGWPNISSS